MDVFMDLSKAALGNAELAHMARAQQLALKGRYTCMPNPRVGCLLVHKGQVIGEGWHRRAGEAHAEVEALADAVRKGNSTEGATAFVTLEPCCHWGKTGPCTEALIEAGIKRVYFGMQDPNPEVAGKGLERLRAAGVETQGPVLEAGAVALNPGFIKRMQTGLPLVRIKMAMSLDGRTAMASGESKWITESAARRDVQRLRAGSCAIVTGIETVLRDDASLTVRADDLSLPEAELIARRQPLRVVLDSEARLSAGKNVLSSAGPVLVVNAEEGSVTGRSVQDRIVQNKVLAGGHIEQIQLPATDGRINLRHLLQELARRQCNEVLVEAGATLAGQFLQQGLVDEMVIYMAAKLLGSSARPLFELPLQTMSSQLTLTIADIRAVGSDWRITARPDVET